MRVIVDLDLAHHLLVQAETPAERTANLRDMESDPATVLDAEMEMVVYPDDEMGNQV
ncbi:MAG TPA: hypothetical protein VF290_21510 [Pyrinomonadaceae bacterium]